MKKIFCLLILFILSVFTLYADEDEEDMGVLDLGAGYSYTSNPKVMGGHLEFGINLYRNIIFIRNSFVLRAGGFKDDDGLDNMVLTLSEKLVLGRNRRISGIYIYMEGGAGFFINNAQNGFSESNLAYSFGFGGGLEFGVISSGVLYFEVGYLGQKMTTNIPLSGVIIQTGMKFYL
jgi:hypothetical protein